MAHLNECLDCKYEGGNAQWLVEGYKGPIHIKETFYVEPDALDPEFLNLEDINADAIAERYGVEVPFVEDLILDGQPICPECGSLNYFIK